MTEPTAVAFHFDVMCPFAYQTSIWIREVRRLTGLEIDWRFFSLEEVNRVEGKKHPWERDWSYGWSMMRIGALLRRTDMALVDEWYLRAATALHVDGHKPTTPLSPDTSSRRWGSTPRSWTGQSPIRPPTTTFGPTTTP